MKIGFSVFFLFFFNFVLSQHIITGNVSNSLNKPIPFVNVLVNMNGNVVSNSLTDNSGKYKIETNKRGKFNLIFSALNHESFSIEIEVFSETKVVEKNITLYFKPTEIKEIIIKYEKPITIKKDTIIFDVKAFLQGNEQVVEDLLKKIPGLNVSSDGVIKVGNQEVEKIMIDGDDFFEKGYKLLTKNMPVQPIDKVELYEHYSNNKHLKGIENSNKVALNLKLKDNVKRQWFGNAQLGYGLFSENRYEVKSNLMNFGKKNKYYFLSNLNNISKDATGDIESIVHPFNNNGALSLGDNESANALLNLNSDLPSLKSKRVNFNNAEMLSLNSIFALTSKIKLKTIGFLNSDENNFYKNSFQSFMVGSTKFENFEDNFVRNKKKLGFGKIDFTYDISKTKTLEYTTKFNFSEDKSNSNLLFNASLLSEVLRTNKQLFDQKIVYTSKIKENRVLLFSGRYINEKSPQNYGVNQFLYQNLFSVNADNLAQSSENKMQFIGFESHFMNRKTNGDLLEFQFGNQFRKDNLVSNFQLKNDETVIDEPISFQNNLSYITNDLYLNTNYLFKFNKLSLTTKAEFHQLINKLEFNETQKPFFINPKIGLNWEINKKNKIATSYSLNKTNATILDVFNGYIQTNSRSFSKGTGNFNQLEALTSFLSYTYGSWNDKFFANSFFTYIKNNDFFSTNTNAVQNYSLSEKILIKDRESLSFSNTIDRYFSFVSSNLKLTFGGSKANFKNIVNNSDLREVKNVSLNYGFEVRSGFRGFFNYNLGSKWDFNEVKTVITNSYINNISFLNLSFIFNDRLNFDIETEQYFFGNLDSQSNKYYFMDLEARYVLKKNKLTLSLSGNNLFNTKTFKNYNISDVDFSNSEYRLQPRYLLMKMELRF